jgi:hypothetical protein
MINIPCHYYSMYINENGQVSPCCQYSNKPIGHISEFNSQLLYNFVPPECKCNGSTLGHLSIHDDISLCQASDHDNINIGIIHFTPTLVCQARCAHCFQRYRRNEKYKDNKKVCGQFMDILDSLKGSVKKIIIQGGEIGIHKKVKLMLKQIKISYPHIAIRVLSNGCLTGDHDLFINTVDEINFGIYAFSELTYKIVSNLDFDIIKHFVERIVLSKKPIVTLKYLINPVNICELPVFLLWATSIRPNYVFISAVTDFEKYTQKFYPSGSKTDEYEFWNIIKNRTGEAIKKIMNSSDYNNIIFDAGTKQLLGIESGIDK